jgi:RNA polymerase sigma factor (sigma-70 family)
MSPTDASEVHASIDHLFRRRAGQMVASLTRVFGLEHLQAVEDAVQDALLQALRHWPYRGIPDDPGAWLVAVARNRVLDRLRRHGTWRSKLPEIDRAVRSMTGAMPGPGPGGEPGMVPSTLAGEGALFDAELGDDQLRLIFACCHPAIPRSGQVALTLKTVGGFSTAEIARAFLSREATVAQRLVRAKRKLREAGAQLEVPAPRELPERLGAVLEVVYLLFNEGYSALEGEAAVRTDLCHEAIRLASLLTANPSTSSARAHALAALLCFQGSRLATRTDAAGELLLLEQQDRSRWDRARIARGLRHLAASAHGEEVSELHLEAEIASCHALAPSFAATDWGRILECYDRLLDRRSSPVVALNRAIALRHVASPAAALDEVLRLEKEPTLADYLPYWAARTELLRLAGRHDEMARACRRALELSASAPVRRFLIRRLNEPRPPN